MKSSEDFVPNERLRRARSLKGWSQADLAEQVGTSFEIVSRWERGVTIPSPYYRERDAAWRCQTHADWNRTDMNVYRHDLVRLARADGVNMTFAAPPAKSQC